MADEDKQTAQLLLRLTYAEREQWREAASEGGVSLNEFVAEAVRKVLRRKGGQK